LTEWALRISEKKSLKKNETEPETDNFGCLTGLQTKLEEPIETRTKGGIEGKICFNFE
jgi:hypothetical protein